MPSFSLKWQTHFPHLTPGAGDAPMNLSWGGWGREMVLLSPSFPGISSSRSGDRQPWHGVYCRVALQGKLHLSVGIPVPTMPKVFTKVGESMAITFHEGRGLFHQHPCRHFPAPLLQQDSCNTARVVTTASSSPLPQGNSAVIQTLLSALESMATEKQNVCQQSSAQSHRSAIW